MLLCQIIRGVLTVSDRPEIIDEGEQDGGQQQEVNMQHHEDQVVELDLRIEDDMPEMETVTIPF